MNDRIKSDQEYRLVKMKVELGDGCMMPKVAPDKISKSHSTLTRVRL